MFILVPLRDVVTATAKVQLPVFTEATVIYTRLKVHITRVCQTQYFTLQQCGACYIRFLFIHFLGEHTIQGQDEVEEPAEDDDDQQTLDGVQEVEEQQPQSPAVSMNIV